MSRNNKSWAIPGVPLGNWCWAGRIPAPELAEETLPPPDFDANGHAEWNGLALDCQLNVTPDIWTLQLTLHNHRETPVTLVSLPLWESIGEVPSSVWRDGFEHILINRLPRQKNDVPGEFHPGLVDVALRNAAFDSSEVIAGGGIAWCEMEEADAVLPLTFYADPGLILSDDRESFAQFFGIAGQTRHLSQVAISTDKARQKLIRLTAAAEGDHRILQPGESFVSHPLVCEKSASAQSLLSHHAARIATNTGSRWRPPISIFCTWYYYGADIDQLEVEKNLQKITQWQLPFDVFQIDMGWENRFGDWQEDDKKFPYGMASTARQIRQCKLIPGIWTAPFVLEPDAAAVKTTPEMLLRNSTGDFCRFQCAKGSCYVLDPTHPAGEAYLIKLFERLKNWGFGYHKLDFLRAVLIHREARFYDPTATRASAYRRGLAAIRRAVGDMGLINCCGGLFEGSAGLADAVRSGFDLRGHWSAEGSEISAYNNRIKQNLTRSFYGRLWMVDPDALQIRRNTAVWKSNEANAHLSRGVFTDDEAFSILVNQYLGGGLVCVSERFPALDADRLALLRKILPNYSRQMMPLAEPNHQFSWLPSRLRADFGDHPSLPPWSIIIAANWESDDPRAIPIPIEAGQASQTDKIAVWDFERQTLLGEWNCGAELTLIVPAHGCRLLRLTPLTSPGANLIGTDGNLSCGMELASWDGNHGILRQEFPSAVTVHCWFLKDGKLQCTEAQTYKLGQ